MYNMSWNGNVCAIVRQPLQEHKALIVCLNTHIVKDPTCACIV